MSMSELWIWWIAAAVLIGAELVTGTFYLLAVGLAAAIGGLLAQASARHADQTALAVGIAVAIAIAVLTFTLLRAARQGQHDHGGHDGERGN